MRVFIMNVMLTKCLECLQSVWNVYNLFGMFTIYLECGSINWLAFYCQQKLVFIHDTSRVCLNLLNGSVLCDSMHLST